jgi:hypothetical protein
MTKYRASIFDEPPGLDVSGLAPKTAPDKDAPAPEKVRVVAEAAHFSSREPKATKKAPATKRQPRLYRTGRNVQMNLKASQETMDAFYAITEQEDWVLGEILENAVQSLQRELKKKT